MQNHRDVSPFLRQRLRQSGEREMAPFARSFTSVPIQLEICAFTAKRRALTVSRRRMACEILPAGARPRSDLRVVSG